MPLKRYEYHRQGDTFTIGETYREDLPKSGLLSGMLVQVSGTMVSGATLSTEATWLLDFLTKLEIVVNGATVVKSLDWLQQLYLVFLEQQALMANWWRNYAAGVQREMLLINFGRYLWDTEFGLDLSKYNRAEIKVTNSGSATYFTGNLTIDILLLYLEDMVGGFSRGYIRSEEYRQWTTVANTTEYIELPTKYPLRGIHLQAIPDQDANFVEETGMPNLIYDVTLGINSRGKKLREGQCFLPMALDNMLVPGSKILPSFADKTADKGFLSGFGYMTGASGVSGAKDGAVSTAVPTINGDNNGGRAVLENREADSPVQLMFTGLAPYNCHSIFYDRLADPAWLLDPSRHGQITLDVLTRNAASAADGTNSLILESVVPPGADR